MGYLLYQIARDEILNQTSAPYPLADVKIEDKLKPDPSQTVTTPNTKFNVSPDFSLTAPFYDRLPMYEFNPANNFPEDFADGLPNKLGLTKVSTSNDAELRRVILASEGQKNLVVYPSIGELTYTDLAVQSESENTNFAVSANIDLYKQSAEDFIRKLELPNTTYEYFENSYVIATSDHPELTDQARGANLIQLKYQARVKDLPIIDKESSLVPNTITIWLNSKGDISRLYYEASGTIGSSVGDYELLDTNEIRRDLQTENTKAKLVNGTYPIGDPIESINIVRGHIAYLAVDNYIVPVYILEANVRVSGNRSGTGYLMLEAIKR